MSDSFKVRFGKGDKRIGWRFIDSSPSVIIGTGEPLAVGKSAGIGSLDADNTIVELVFGNEESIDVLIDMAKKAKSRFRSNYQWKVDDPTDQGK